MVKFVSLVDVIVTPVDPFHYKTIQNPKLTRCAGVNTSQNNKLM
jgi:hypothetical protein